MDETSGPRPAAIAPIEIDFLSDERAPLAVAAQPPTTELGPGPGALFWHARAVALSDLVAAHGELVERSSERDRAQRARDAALRAAREAGWTYDDIIARIGVSSTTITNAVRRS